MAHGPVGPNEEVVEPDGVTMELVGRADKEGHYRYSGVFAREKAGRYGFSVRGVRPTPTWPRWAAPPGRSVKRVKQSAAALRVIADQAATDLQELAGAITQTIDALPANASRATITLLEQHARRALAIAAALRVEESDANAGVVRALLMAKRAVVTAVVAVLATVAVGCGEEMGSDAYHRLRNLVERQFEKQTETRKPKAEWPFEGNFLRLLRERAGLAQADVAAAVGVSRQSVSRYENNDAQPSMEQVDRIAEVMAERLQLRPEAVRSAFDEAIAVIEAAMEDHAFDNTHEGLTALYAPVFRKLLQEPRLR